MGLLSKRPWDLSSSAGHLPADTAPRLRPPEGAGPPWLSTEYSLRVSGPAFGVRERFRPFTQLFLSGRKQRGCGKSEHHDATGRLKHGEKPQPPRQQDVAVPEGGESHAREI